MERFKHGVRLKFTFAGAMQTNITPQKIYVKSDWQPDLGPRNLEATLNFFQTRLVTAGSTISHHNKSSNLTNTQQHILNFLRNIVLAVLTCVTKFSFFTKNISIGIGIFYAIKFVILNNYNSKHRAGGPQ